MKTRTLIIIGIIAIIAVYLPIHYYYPFLGIGSTTGTFVFCESGFVQSGDKCVPDSKMYTDSFLGDVPEAIPSDDFDSTKYTTVFDEGSPLQEIGTGNAVLTEDNCHRYAYWLTKYQKEKLDRYKDYPNPPWGNKIFPLVDYCIKNGDLIKTIVNDKIQWSFSGISGNSEPEFKDEKITIIKISKGEIVSEKAIKFNGWTNQPNQEIVLTVTAPNGNVISTGKLSSMNNGTFADSITTGGPLWKQQDGIYLVTVQQGNDPTNSAYFELDLKDGNIITGK